MKTAIGSKLGIDATKKLPGESLVAIMNLFLLPYGCLLPALHCRPWAARSIADF